MLTELFYIIIYHNFSSIEPFFIENGFGLTQEYRMCAPTVKLLSVALCSTIIRFIIPVSIVTIVYSINLYQVHQSARRVSPHIISDSTPKHTSLPGARRILKMMQNIIISPYLILILWNHLVFNKKIHVSNIV
jgi:hypothetical protein